MAKMQCPKCGTQFEADKNTRVVSCPGCQTKLRNPYAEAPAGRAYASPNPMAPLPPTERKSEFKGTVGSHFGLVITNVLLFIFTLTIATPWIICRNYRWRISNKVIDGKKLVFDGKGSQLIGKWILWWFLGVITLTIYSWFIPIKLQQWIASHTKFEGEENSAGTFDGRFWSMVGLRLTNALLVIFTLGIGTAWAINRDNRWEINHTSIAGRRLGYEGKGGKYFCKLFVWGLLSVITLSIYAWWVPVKEEQFITENTHFVL